MFAPGMIAPGMIAPGMIAIVPPQPFGYVKSLSTVSPISRHFRFAVFRPFATAAAFSFLALCLAGTGAEAQQRRQKTKAKAVATETIRLILPQALDASGVLQALEGDLRARYRLSVKYIPASLSRALQLATKGEADVVIFDHYGTAKKFVAEKRGISLADVMYTDLIVVGPANDPAGIAGMISAFPALQKIARSESPFISRGDGSTTLRVEREVWSEISLDPKSSENAWYTQTGADMRTTLGLAAAKNAYTITDRATWLRFRARKQLVVMVDNDPRLMLRYAVVVLNPASFSEVKAKAGERFVQWLTSKAVQERIGRYQITGKVPFSPHYGLQR